NLLAAQTGVPRGTRRTRPDPSTTPRAFPYARTSRQPLFRPPLASRRFPACALFGSRSKEPRPRQALACRLNGNEFFVRLEAVPFVGGKASGMRNRIKAFFVDHFESVPREALL